MKVSHHPSVHDCSLKWNKPVNSSLFPLAEVFSLNTTSFLSLHINSFILIAQIQKTIGQSGASKEFSVPGD